MKNVSAKFKNIFNEVIIIKGMININELNNDMNDTLCLFKNMKDFKEGAFILIKRKELICN